MAYTFGARIDDDSYALTTIDEDQGTASTKGEINGVPFEDASGGGTEPLIVTADTETDALNYTWREILDAYLEGRNIILASVNSDGDGQWVAMTTIEKHPSTNEYLVSFGTAASYTASSENEYPTAE